jgi:hypothetical protein
MTGHAEARASRAMRRWAGRLARWRWLVGLALAAAIGIAASHLAPSNGEVEVITGPQRPLAGSPPATPEDLAWQSLAPDQRRILKPLQGIWASMDDQEQQVWRLVAKHVQRKPLRFQQRLQKRMHKWAQLTPNERARARLNFMQIAGRYDVKQREKQWSEYHSPRVEPRPQPPRAEPVLRAEAPASVQIRPGATTVLLSQLNDGPDRNTSNESGSPLPTPSPSADPALQSVPIESGS